MTEPELLAEQALAALNQGDPDRARELLEQAIAEDRRPDLLHALGVVVLQLGNPEVAAPLLEEALDGAWRQGAAPDLLLQVNLALASAREDQDLPRKALEVYEQALEVAPEHPRALVGRAHLLLSMGRLDEGLAQLDGYLAQGRDEEEYLEGAAALVAAIRSFRIDGVVAGKLLKAHRESYVDFFDHTASKMAEQGWIAECARMVRGPSGQLVPSIPQGARPYAAVRVDLVDPSSGQAGQVGEQPMVVALAGYEPLAHAPVLFEQAGAPYRVCISSQCPWDQLPVHVLLEDGEALPLVEPRLGDWYGAGFHGRFGSKEEGRFHYISDPISSRQGRALTVHVDLGRSTLLAIDALLDSLAQLHAQHPIAMVLLGRGHLDA